MAEAKISFFLIDMNQKKKTPQTNRSVTQIFTVIAVKKKEVTSIK